MNWGIISGIITFPIVFAIASSFTRREQAIDSITKIKSALYNITHNDFMFGYKINKDISTEKKNYDNDDDLSSHNKHYTNLLEINFDLIDTIKLYLLTESLNSPY